MELHYNTSMIRESTAIDNAKFTTYTVLIHDQKLISYSSSSYEDHVLLCLRMRHLLTPSPEIVTVLYACFDDVTSKSSMYVKVSGNRINSLFFVASVFKHRATKVIIMIVVVASNFFFL